MPLLHLSREMCLEGNDDRVRLWCSAGCESRMATIDQSCGWYHGACWRGFCSGILLGDFAQRDFARRDFAKWLNKREGFPCMNRHKIEGNQRMSWNNEIENELWNLMKNGMEIISSILKLRCKMNRFCIESRNMHPFGAILLTNTNWSRGRRSPFWVRANCWRWGSWCVMPFQREVEVMEALLFRLC